MSLVGMTRANQLLEIHPTFFYHSTRNVKERDRGMGDNRYPLVTIDITDIISRDINNNIIDFIYIIIMYIQRDNNRLCVCIDIEWIVGVAKIANKSGRL